jgi:hypothetical protein
VRSLLMISAGPPVHLPEAMQSAAVPAIHAGDHRRCAASNSYEPDFAGGSTIQRVSEAPGAATHRMGRRPGRETGDERGPRDDARVGVEEGPSAPARRLRPVRCPAKPVQVRPADLTVPGRRGAASTRQPIPGSIFRLVGVAAGWSCRILARSSIADATASRRFSAAAPQPSDRPSSRSRTAILGTGPPLRPAGCLRRPSRPGAWTSYRARGRPRGPRLPDDARMDFVPVRRRCRETPRLAQRSNAEGPKSRTVRPGPQAADWCGDRLPGSSSSLGRGSERGHPSACG